MRGLIWLDRRKKSSHILEDSIIFPKYFKEVGRVVNPDHYTFLESSHPLQKLYSLDSYYFNGVDSEGRAVILRIAKRPNREAEVWIVIKDPKRAVVFELPTHPQVTVIRDIGVEPQAGESKIQEIQAAGLSFQCREPMRAWKVRFDGILRVSRVLNDDTPYKLGSFVRVRFDFQWTAISEPLNFDRDIPSSVIAAGLSLTPWSRAFFDGLRNSHQTHYEQHGSLQGVICYGELSRNNIDWLQLKGMRDHSFGMRHWGMFYRYVTHLLTLDNGSFCHLSFISTPLFNHFVCGFLVSATGTQLAIIKSNRHLRDLGENGVPPKDYSLNFLCSDGITHILNVKLTDDEIRFHLGDGATAFETLCSVTLDGISGKGIVEFMYNSGLVPPPHWYRIVANPEHNRRHIYEFTDRTATQVSQVGGKAAQLAVLVQLRDDMFSYRELFHIPEGFIISVYAHNEAIAGLPRPFQEQLFLLNKALSTNNDDLIRHCEEIQRFYRTMTIPQQMRLLIQQHYQNLTQGNYLPVVVRSSGVGEDSGLASSAGQLETILGVGNFDELLDGILQCWASQYSERAVRYRFQHGQPIISTMGVIVQSLVQSIAAGVCFTANPLTGERDEIFTSANYGIGVSVVDGNVNPDHFVVTREYFNESVPSDPFWGNVSTWIAPILTVQTKTLGSKHQKAIYSQGKLITRSTSEQEQESFCLSEEQLLQISTAAILCEHEFGGQARDIEWALDEENHLYILQARPVTSSTLISLTEYPINKNSSRTFGDLLLEREFDSALPSGTEWNTTANVAEMIPGAITPLTLSTFTKAVDIGMQDMFYQCGNSWPKLLPNTSHFITISANHAFINLSVLGITYAKISLDKRGGDLGIAGRELCEITKEELLSYHGGRPSRLQRLKNLFGFLKMLNSAGSRVKFFSNLVRDRKFDLVKQANEFHWNSLQLYQAINKTFFSVFCGAWRDTIEFSAKSGAWSHTLMHILAGSKEWNSQHYSDVARLLSHCSGVVSAEVVPHLNDIILEIRKSPHYESRFLLAHEIDAWHWLESNENRILTQKLEKFLQTQGHRCIREAELRELSWGMNPVQLVRVIQQMLQNFNQSQSQSQKSLAEGSRAIGQLSSKPNFLKRLLLRVMVPIARNAVRNREFGKSVAVQIHNEFKRAYHLLASLAVQENILPEKDLLFFFTHFELGQLLKNPSPELIARANARLKSFSQIQDYQFDFLSKGLPVPNRQTEKPPADGILTDDGLVFKGFPVSRGIVQGKARVILSVNDAESIEKNEILIVPFTDVGWTVYFPLIAGLVTELGGLLSHGAVCAREYRIPCIVNIPGICVSISTGDEVLLDGNSGTLTKL